MEINLLKICGLQQLIMPEQRVFLPAILFAFIVGWLVSCHSRRCFIPRKWWQQLKHPSALLDYRLYFLTSVIKVTLIAPLIPAGAVLAAEVALNLEGLFGYHRYRVEGIWLPVIHSLTLLIFHDLSRYGLHRLMHSLRWLWAFHRVHHSAEVLNPLTFHRVHPVESFLFGLRYALVSGLITGGFLYAFGFQVVGQHLIYSYMAVIFGHLLSANLRHSFVSMAFSPRMERFFLSPCQHQWHHLPQGSRQNFGSLLAVWDLIFGSLKLSSDKPCAAILSYGLPCGLKHHSAKEFFLEPFQYLQRQSWKSESSFWRKPNHENEYGSRSKHPI